MRRVLLAGIWANVAVVIMAFFLPWAHLEVREAGRIQDVLSKASKEFSRITVKVRRGAETITGDLPSLSDIPPQVRGIDIPRLANQEQARVATALVELLLQQRKHLGLKSYAVYLVPCLAIVCGLLLTLWGREPAVALGVAAGCAVIAGMGFWKLLTVNPQMVVLTMTFGIGLWLSLWGYVGLCMTAIGCFIDTHSCHRL